MRVYLAVDEREDVERDAVEFTVDRADDALHLDSVMSTPGRSRPAWSLVTP